MATFPSYVKLGLRDIGDAPTPVVARTEMDRGIAKQRRIAADTVVKVSATLYFDSRDDADAFEEWVYTEIGGGAGWFDFVHPRSLATVSGRIVGGDIGTLKPSNQSWSYSERSLVIEYVRPAL